MANTQSGFKVRGTNLGGWLVIEGWIKPELFKAIPNKDFLDGTTLRFKSAKTKKYLSANSGGGESIVANCENENCDWNKFRLWRINESTFKFKVPKNQFVGLEGTHVVAVATNDTESATFEIIKESEDSNRVRIRPSNGSYLQVNSDNSVTADVEVVSGWENNDPTVFNFTLVRVYPVGPDHKKIEGDFQLQNGLGKAAKAIMQEHYRTFIVEKDFKLMSDYGINAVRIPVGWWTAKDPNPHFPFVSGTLQALDSALYWAKKYGLKIILDLHAAPGSQSGVAHSVTRDGSIEWGKTNENIEQTLGVIEFFVKRYHKNDHFYGIELLNEPRHPDVTLETVEKYYREAHKMIRQYSSTIYVIFSESISFEKFGDEHSSFLELVPLANSLDNTVIDVHWYNFFKTSNKAEEHIEYIREKRTQDLSHHMTKLQSNNGKALIYIGEWSCGGTTGAKLTPEEAKEFVKTQIELYNQASFGWTFWTWKIDLEKYDDEHYWSLKWLIENDIIILRS